MGYFLRCDVKGCDEIVPIPNPNVTPREWRIVVFEEMDPEKQQLAKERLGYSDGMPGVAMLAVKRSVYVCPEHDLPEFDDELVFATDEMLV